MASVSVLNSIAVSNARANLVETHQRLQEALDRFSNGLRINDPGGDAASVAVANANRASTALRSLGRRRAADGPSTLGVEDGPLNNATPDGRIRDASVAEESANLTRYNILTQSGIAALSQANQHSAAVLSLLR